jgi:hypothetical protein
LICLEAGAQEWRPKAPKCRTRGGWFKGGHDDFTGNFLLCLEQGRRCVLMMSNDVRAESLFPHIATLLLGPTRMPWRWEYGATAP